MDLKTKLRYFRDFNAKLLLETDWKFCTYRNTVVNIAESAALQLHGEFRYSARWNEQDPFPSLFCMRNNSKLSVLQNFDIYSASKIYINTGATLKLGSGYINHNLNLSCFEYIATGQDVAISENVNIRDSDNHEIINSSRQMTKPVIIGDHVWIGMNVTIHKGAHIGDGSIIAASSVVNKDIPAKCLAAGVPAKVIKHNVEWR